MGAVVGGGAVPEPGGDRAGLWGKQGDGVGGVEGRLRFASDVKERAGG